jgi:quercetin dioxygenase-like cupin family protein
MPVGNTRHVRELLTMVRISDGIGNPGRAHPRPVGSVDAGGVRGFQGAMERRHPMLKPIFAVALTVLCSLALVSADQRTVGAQDKAQISDVFKDRLAVDDPKLVSVRQYDVPPGWATPMHQHTGHMFLYIVEGSGAMETEGQVRAADAGQVIHQLPGKPMIMKNASNSARLKFILFQIGPEGPPLTVPVQ